MPTRHLTLELNSPYRPGDLARPVTAWLTEAQAALLPDHTEEPADGPAPRGPREDDPDAPWGPPHGLYAQLLVKRGPHSSFRSSRFSARRRQRLLAGLHEDPPHHIVLQLHRLDARGLPEDPELCAELECQWLPGDPEVPGEPRWLRCSATLPVGRPPWPDAAGVAARWCDSLATWATRLDAAYGHLTDDASTEYGTALERVLHRWPEDTVPRCDRTLRGYSWVTLCSPGIAARTGGVRALRSSGAFAEVRELPAGQVVLRATPGLDEYTGEAPALVLRALAPVLPPGRTERAYLSPWMRLVPEGDSADFR
ncbi:hypothetical protein [Streptomyces sp. HNM0574]|uniref:hypothetical protein n=1 Tax=Streptomyces sp. HNM0574 TaxID=2714954 RepID=UPI00146DE4D9|nr:hypothetical protein [Streptomyces sp. HNM0574]NLU66004.1 hypothetical protein [Streptomyces sp. HNM0574]